MLYNGRRESGYPGAVRENRSWDMSGDRWRQLGSLRGKLALGLQGQ